MFEQIKKAIEEVGTKKGILPYMNHFVMLGAENMFIYRMFVKNPKVNMDTKYMNRIGCNAFGNLTMEQIE